MARLYQFKEDNTLSLWHNGETLVYPLSDKPYNLAFGADHTLFLLLKARHLDIGQIIIYQLTALHAIGMKTFSCLDIAQGENHGKFIGIYSHPTRFLGYGL